MRSARLQFPFLWNNERFGGGRGSRTPDLVHAKDALSQLSYAPTLNRPSRISPQSFQLIELPCFLREYMHHY